MTSEEPTCTNMDAVTQAYEPYVLPLLELAMRDDSTVRPEFSVKRSFIWKSYGEDVVLTATLTIFAALIRGEFMVHLTITGTTNEDFLEHHTEDLSSMLTLRLYESGCKVIQESKISQPADGIALRVLSIAKAD